MSPHLSLRSRSRKGSTTLDNIARTAAQQKHPCGRPTRAHAAASSLQLTAAAGGCVGEAKATRWVLKLVAGRQRRIGDRRPRGDGGGGVFGVRSRDAGVRASVICARSPAAPHAACSVAASCRCSTQRSQRGSSDTTLTRQQQTCSHASAPSGSQGRHVTATRCGASSRRPRREVSAAARDGSTSTLAATNVRLDCRRRPPATVRHWPALASDC
jgi:hypothetical protein